jgi:predicted dehydrogenase
MKSIPARSAIVGAGVMGRWHADAISRLGARVSAVIDPDADRAGDIARRYAGCRVFKDIDAATGVADVFHICTPTGSHVDLTVRAIAAGRHVLVEKPLAATAAETEQLFDLALARGVLLCPVYQFLFQPGVQRALTLISDIEPVRDVQMTFWSAGARTGPAAVQDAIAFEILPHPFYLLARLLPLDLAQTEWSVVRTGAGELRVYTSAGTASVSIRVSMHGRPTTANAVVTGERGTLVMDLFHGFSIRQPGAVSRTRKIVQPFQYALTLFGTATVNLARRAARREPAYPGLRELIRRMYAATAGTQPAPISRAEAVAVAVASDSIAAALQRSRRAPTH